MSADRTPWVIRRVPPVGRLFTGKPDADAYPVNEAFGEIWQPRTRITPTPLPLIVVFSPRPALMRWIASSLAATLPAVVVVADSGAVPRSTVADATLGAVAYGADPDRLGIIAETDAAAPVIAHLATPGIPPMAPPTRLAFISPLLPADEALPVGGIPPSLLQFSHGSETAPPILEWERRLRATGVAVRSIDYRTLRDGWARYPRAVRGHQRGLDDLTGFFRRGFGVESTFGVIPGWDLH